MIDSTVSNAGRESPESQKHNNREARLSFFALPYEIRVTVYKYLAMPLKHHNRHFRRRLQCTPRGTGASRLGHPPVLDAMLICRQFYHEIRQILPMSCSVLVNRESQLTKEHPALLDRTGLVKARFWHVRPMLQVAQHIVGHWSFRSTIAHPSVPFDFISGKRWNWRSLQMIANLRDEIDSQSVALTRQERLKNILVEQRALHKSIDQFIRHGKQNGLEVTVLVRIEDRGLGRVGCTCLLGGGRIRALSRSATYPREEALRKLVCEVFELSERNVIIQHVVTSPGQHRQRKLLIETTTFRWL